MTGRIVTPVNEQGDAPDAIAVHDINKNVADIAAEAQNCPMEIFTFNSAFAMDSALRLTGPNTAGIFWARLRGAMPEIYFDDTRYHLSRQTIYPEEWLREKQMRFVVTGYYPDYDASVVRYAEEQGFTRRTVGTIQGHEISLYYDVSCLRQQP
jgi:hypothetical protein